MSFSNNNQNSSEPTKYVIPGVQENPQTDASLRSKPDDTYGFYRPPSNLHSSIPKTPAPNSQHFVSRQYSRKAKAFVSVLELIIRKINKK